MIESKVNSWLSTYYNNNFNNYDFCEMFVEDILSIVQKKYNIVDKNKFRDELIYIIYKFSYER
jgi:uncharacterized membrane protein YcgQ (UPF0703/DUF1980 family)